MSDVHTIELATAAIVDCNDRVLLARGENYDWELPGRKVSDVPTGLTDEDIRFALSGALKDKLEIDVEPDEVAMPHIDEVSVSTGGLLFQARIFRVQAFRGVPMETRMSGYTGTTWANFLHWGIGRLSLSPVAAEFYRRVNNDPTMITRGG